MFRGGYQKNTKKLQKNPQTITAPQQVRRGPPGCHVTTWLFLSFLKLFQRPIPLFSGIGYLPNKKTLLLTRAYYLL